MSRISIGKKVKQELDTKKKVSSKQGAQKNKKPTCNHCGKIGHTSNKCWSNGKAKFNGKYYNCSQHGHRANECKEKLKFEGKCHKSKKQGHKASNYKSKSFNPTEKIEDFFPFK